jgi:glucose-6-phosphate isomerase, archaeal
MSESPKAVEPFGVELDLDRGVMANPRNRLVRRASDMCGYYADGAALDRLIAAGDPVHYEVFEVPVPETPGHLMYCISTLQPGTVGESEECFMTKGHYHAVIDTAEIYLCLGGRGLILMKTAAGRCEWQEMSRGRMVYVPPAWAHRSVNTGAEPLVSFCVYPAEAGHNYGDIQSDGFPRRVFLRNGKVTVE